MAVKTTPLTDTQIKALKATSKDKKYFDGGGLFLLVKSTGVKLWRFKYKKPISHKETLLSFGKYPETSLQQARKQRDEARELIKQGIDPQHHKAEQEQRKQEACNNTFYAMAEKWLKFKTEQGLEEQTLKKAWRSLENHVFPYIKDIPINQVTAIKAINALQPLNNNNKYETVKRVCRRINEIMYYAVNMGIIDNNPLAKITDVFNSPKVKNQPTIPPTELPQFMQALAMAKIELQTRCVIEWQLLTLTRPSEAVGAKWEEINLDKKLWSIPAERMKMDRPHNIPLSPQAIKILEIMKSINHKSEFVFPTARPPYNKPMSSQTANMAIKRMGYKDKLVAHGLRALASTALNEQGFNYDVIESALSHVDKNAVRRAYNKAEYEHQKRIMLDWWGDFVEQASQGNVSLSGNRNLKLVNH
ncbi:integrase domain-containing protein [Gilliamella sp. ESL0250]|uniref:integrase domain-containing protein n=1 Tax=Gilliamella sp. ESL0250 TaxID=2705036 RepID=UPI001580241D|nr:integrase domain-containing protein [Gilliamella sp. ESL0250]MCO6556643.1 tyrosine-type recombinase/integrase [Gilliamella sp.]NUF49222.1 tyrosine-type recombinase/integrase [Gilliamella sp. ESL0250]